MKMDKNKLIEHSIKINDLDKDLRDHKIVMIVIVVILAIFVAVVQSTTEIHIMEEVVELYGNASSMRDYNIESLKHPLIFDESNCLFDNNNQQFWCRNPINIEKNIKE